jgi:hypothetical protein
LIGCPHYRLTGDSELHPDSADAAGGADNHHGLAGLNRSASDRVGARLLLPNQ